VPPPEQVGNKAYNLMRLQREGLRIPPGFVLNTDLTFQLPKDGFSIFDDPIVSAMYHTRVIASRSGRQWHPKADNPALFSVRSGALVSMPGMMETILNIGLNDHNVDALSKLTNRRFALDSYRRLIQSMAVVVHGVPDEKFSEVLKAANEYYVDLDETGLEVVLGRYKKLYQDHVGEEFPQNIDTQLQQATNAVYRSWFNDKAVTYRENMNIPHHLGTAVTVQEMKFGNLNERSGTGVMFTRCPMSGGPFKPMGDFLPCAQGEDVVAGTHATKSLDDMYDDENFVAAAKELRKVAEKLDLNVFRDMVDIEFTIEDSVLWILQARVGKRSPEAAVRTAVHLVISSVIGETEATDRIMKVVNSATPATKQTEGPEQSEVMGKGLGACKGIATAKAVFTQEHIDQLEKDEPYIFLANLTSPDDNGQMFGAAGILTATGGLVSHAALVAREWNIPTVVGCPNMTVASDKQSATFTTDDLDYVIQPFDFITVNGTTGEVLT
jgi:pyruvate,orthophosphate dikinase